MTYPSYMREKARQLRRNQQLTIDEIAERLAVSRTTVFFWIGDMPRPARCRKRKGTGHALGNAAMQAKYRRLRERAYQEGVYSDAAVIAIADRWLRRLSRNKLTYWVQYHADQDLPSLQRFWAGLVGVDADEIRLLRKSNSNQLKGRTWRSEHGVLTVTTHDTYFRAKLQAWVDLLRRRWLDSAPLRHFGA
jgi:AcrR family transcriptional regulator